MHSRFVTAAFTAFGFCTLAAADAVSSPVPDGWHVVPFSEFKGTEDFHFRLKQPSGGLQASADFDGDGRVDFARVLESNDHHTCAVFLTYFTKGRITHRELDRLDSSCKSERGASLFVVVEGASHGKIETWCGKGVSCEKGDADFIRLQLPGIGIGLYEASYSIVFWNSKSRTWHTALISD